MSSYHQESLGYLTGLASRLFNKLLTNRFKAAGIDMTAEQWGVIVTLMNNHSPLTQRQIGEVLYLEKSSVSRSIAGLEKRGWINRKQDPEDSRKKWVHLSPKSNDIAEQCLEIAKGVLADVENGLDRSQIQQNSALLTQVIKNLRSEIEE